MRTLITIVIAALSLNAFGQGIPQLPYNPDENGDGLIGVPDLQGLLSQYGLEFNSAVVSDDAESAIVYMGQMAHPVCNLACDNLPGFWHMSTMDDLGLVWDELDYNSAVWFSQGKEKTFANGTAMYDYSYYNNSYHKTCATPDLTMGCYCAAHELPKVEYSYCEGGDIQGCAEDKVSNGWYPLNGVSSHHKFPGLNSSNSAGADYQWKVQAFWRWAE
jgi:hypothetical protein